MLATAPSAPRHFIYFQHLHQLFVKSWCVPLTSPRLVYINSQGPWLGGETTRCVREWSGNGVSINKTHSHPGPAALWNHFLHSSQPSGGFGRLSARLNKQHENVQTAGVIIPRQVNCAIGQPGRGSEWRRGGELAPAGTRAK